MKKIPSKVYKFIKYGIFGFIGLLTCIVVWYFTVSPDNTGEWWPQLNIASTATIQGDIVEVKNVRNFRYGIDEHDVKRGYYTKKYDASKISKVWYVFEPDEKHSSAAHTFLSFEFDDGSFLSMSIEARKRLGENWDPIVSLWRKFPLMIIAADERDVVMLRANVRKHRVFIYPVNTTREKAKDLFMVYINRMNKLQEKPEWYNTITANCTSEIAENINSVTPGKVPFSYKYILAGFADSYAYDLGLIDTGLSFEQARKKYDITEKSRAIGDVPNYSTLIRQQ